ncbi:MAG: uroporphyrinogen-III C-methyltransferase [Burkholderiales bacterium]|nr:uroporphyrinogen-III C-methyltransferase [Burkholderiales bacterium]
MDFLPVSLVVKDRPCVVVGGGEVAARKAQMLLRAQARVTVVAPALGEAVQRMQQAQRIRHVAARFRDEHLEAAVLVIAATDEQSVNEAVHRAACARGIPVNVVDQPRLCTFAMPAIIDRSPVLIAISSGGFAPVLARLLRARIESVLPAGLGRLAQLGERFREMVKGRLPDPDARRRFWEFVFQGRVADLAMAGAQAHAEQALEALLCDAERGRTGLGEVYLVGAGPGDPDLLTFRALRLMQQADVVVYDHLVGDGILDLVRRDARHIYVGKERDNHTLPQAEINELLLRLAQQGKRVLRLKGGDPFIFGRGGEEIETLSTHGVPFQVVPGITAASGMACYAGIPLTHRDHAHACVFVTGHLKDGSVDLDWPALARPGQTVVVYMGMGALPEICRQLVRHGLPHDTPAAVVRHATTRRQKVVSGSLETLPHLAHAAQLTAPALIVIGEVVKLRRKLSWFAPDAQPRALVNTAV